ncbi:extended synaptotagmin-2 isoform X2 [Condylostylus longicornis]|uniref:extended synaptotagmin-2 isoform X2 n=1 Tax=Condylostylus longicornis TaxID=2530218 RepID=UPI00244E1E19|nr:extended synaptotagmin-2 isoform X2 [Condylostylus longicornis]
MSANEEFDQSGGLDSKDSGTYSSDISSSLEVIGADLNIEDNADPLLDMAAASKEISSDNVTENLVKSAEGSSDEGIFSLIYTVVKKVAIVGTVYLLGYMGWSVAWLVAPVALSVARDQWKKSADEKRTIAKASALTNEKEVILARIDELPAWVYFPDVERCEWVNKILKQVWPNANHYARTLVKDVIEPSVAEALRNYKMNGFQFDRIILGTIPPRIGGVKIYDKNVGRNEIIMDLDLFYAGDCDINFRLGGMKGGIKDFQIHGMVRVVMKPLIRSMPLVGGLQIFFLNNPNIDFNLVGVIDLLDMPGLSDILRRVIVEQIAAVMVLPNKLPITLSEEVAAQTLKMPEPEGVLRIHVVEAKDLMKKDISVLGKGKSDPYGLISVGAQEFRTQTIDNTVNPKWDYWCEAIISVNSGQLLEFQLFDFDPSSSDEKLGRATVEISNVVKKGVLDTWLTLEDAKHGLLHVRLTWYKLSSNTADLQAALEETQLLRVTSMSTAILCVYIDSAKNLPQARPQSQPDPYLTISVGKHIEQTAVQLRTDAPVWEQGYSFLVGNPDNDTLQLKITDQKTEKEIGRYTYILSALLQRKNMEFLQQPFQLQKSGPESKIIMTLSLRILKRADPLEGEPVADVHSLLQRSSSQMSRSDSTLSRGGSVKAPQQPLETSSVAKTKDTPPSVISDSVIPEEDFTSAKVTKLSSSPSGSTKSSQSSLHHRVPDITSSAGEYGLGRIQLSLRYHIQRQKLTVTVHKIMNIPLKDPSNIPDPYVKLYLLPGRTKESKRKTATIKDNCNPVYDSSFEYLISIAELMNSELEVTVCTQKGFLSGGSPIIGMLKIALSDPEISSQGFSNWYDLLPHEGGD